MAGKLAVAVRVQRYEYIFREREKGNLGKNDVGGGPAVISISKRKDLQKNTISSTHISVGGTDRVPQ